MDSLKQELYFYQFKVPAPIKTITLVASNSALLELNFGRFSQAAPKIECKKTSNKIIRSAEAQLLKYFDGRLKIFDIPLNPQGSIFQKAAWGILEKIPYGKTISYKEEALKMGSSNYSRAIGQANGKNPIAIIIPCHRVIASDGSMGGYSGGLAVKRFLLDLESNATENEAL